MPIISVSLDFSEEGNRIFKNFNRIHPRYLIFKQKTIGVAMIKLNDFANAEAFIKSINGKNSAAYFSRKASRDGYTFQSINPNELETSLLEVNSSAVKRQGRTMDDSYKSSINYPMNARNLYYGIFKDEMLVAYLWIVKTGELAIINRILGHASHLNNGIMYYMVTSYIELELKEKGNTHFVMYDTFLGAGDGLKMFKSRCGFQPYRIIWKQC